MEELHNLIGTDCMNIILDYKKEFERIEHNYKLIDNCIFEEFDKDLFEEIFDNKEYERLEKFKHKHYLNNMTFGEFKDYYLQENYFHEITFKFSINGITDDYFKTDIKKIKSHFMRNLKIEYIYKLGSFDICLFLGNYKSHQLETLYENIANDIYINIQNKII